MNRIVVTHREQRFDKTLLLFGIEIRPRRKHAMVVRWRRPYLTQSALGYQSLFAHSLPKRTADSARISSPIQHSSHHFDFARPRITVFADVAVEAQGAVINALAHTLLR